MEFVLVCGVLEWMFSRRLVCWCTIDCTHVYSLGSKQSVQVVTVLFLPPPYPSLSLPLLPLHEYQQGGAVGGGGDHSSFLFHQSMMNSQASQVKGGGAHGQRNSI